MGGGGGGGWGGGGRGAGSARAVCTHNQMRETSSRNQTGCRTGHCGRDHVRQGGVVQGVRWSPGQSGDGEGSGPGPPFEGAPSSTAYQDLLSQKERKKCRFA